MIKKSLVMMFTVFLLSMSLVSCSIREEFKFLNPIDEIESVSIIEMSLDENNKPVQTHLADVEDKDAFIEELCSIKCYRWFGDPTGIINSEQNPSNVIKIIYENKEYELINWNGQADYTIERDFRFYRGYNVFDENSFKDLINKYLEMGYSADEVSE